MRKHTPRERNCSVYAPSCVHHFSDWQKGTLSYHQFVIEQDEYWESQILDLYRASLLLPFILLVNSTNSTK